MKKVLIVGISCGFILSMLLENNIFILLGIGVSCLWKKTIDIKILYVSVLCTIFEQGIKVYIYKFCLASEINVLGELVQFTPRFNRKLSLLGNYSTIFSNEVFLILLNFLLLYIYISGYSFYKSKQKHCSTIATIIVTMGIAGSLCSLFDKVIWNGSLDYISIKNFYVFDLKDCFITISQVLIIVYGIKYRKQISIREYFFYLKKSFEKDMIQ